MLWGSLTYIHRNKLQFFFTEKWRRLKSKPMLFKAQNYKFTISTKESFLEKEEIWAEKTSCSDRLLCLEIWGALEAGLTPSSLVEPVLLRCSSVITSVLSEIDSRNWLLGQASVPGPAPFRKAESTERFLMGACLNEENGSEHWSLWDSATDDVLCNQRCCSRRPTDANLIQIPNRWRQGGLFSVARNRRRKSAGFHLILVIALLRFFLVRLGLTPLWDLWAKWKSDWSENNTEHPISCSSSLLFLFPEL